MNFEKGLFLDRDGVVNVEHGYVCRPQDFILQPAFFELAQLAFQQQYRLVIITNQGGVAKGLYDMALVHQLHNQVQDGLAQHGLPPASFYVCPHHPDFTSCLCRKPGALWFERALHRYRLNPARSWMIGDRERDLIPAHTLGMHTVMVGDHTSPYAHTHLPDMQQVVKYFHTTGVN